MTALLAIGLALAARPAVAQQSDLLPQRELRENLRRMHLNLREGFAERESAGRIRAEALASARAARAEALANARIQRESARELARMDRLRTTVRMRPLHIPPIRDRVRIRRYRDI